MALAGLEDDDILELKESDIQDDIEDDEGNSDSE
jgi:hypothetical protein